MKTVNIRVDKSVSHRYFDDYINSIDMWCTVNCSGDYSIKVSEAPTYKLPINVEIEFAEPSEAAHFKLSPLWTEEIRK